MVYSYRHGFSGFAAKLTESQAQTIAGNSDIFAYNRFSTKNPIRQIYFQSK